jgi:hypothetical protein
MDGRYFGVALITLLLVAAFFLVPSALGQVEMDAGGSGYTPTPTAEPEHLPPLHPSEQYTIERVLRWLPMTAQISENYNYTDILLFHDIRPEFILGIIAQESFGFANPHKVFDLPYDRVGSVGLMAVAPFEWRGYTKEQLLSPWTNVKVGIGILLDAYQLPYNVENDYSLRTALALYNCGTEYLSENRCGLKGGYAYADRIIGIWAPHFREALFDEQWKTLYSWDESVIATTDEWLAKFGIGGRTYVDDDEETVGLVENIRDHFNFIRLGRIYFSARGRYRSR